MPFLQVLNRWNVLLPLGGEGKLDKLTHAVLSSVISRTCHEIEGTVGADTEVCAHYLKHRHKRNHDISAIVPGLDESQDSPVPLLFRLGEPTTTTVLVCVCVCVCVRLRCAQPSLAPSSPAQRAHCP